MNYCKRLLAWGLGWVLFLSCAYYNTFYNANKYYREAMVKQKSNPSSAKSNFEKAIEKSALVISKYPRSKYTPHALFIIGVCYYYLGEYSKAIAKFEILSSVFPQNKFRDEANLYWANALVAINDYNAALEKLQSIKLSSSKTLSRTQYESALLKLSELYYLLGDYPAAENELNNFIRNYPKSPLLLNSMLLLGDVQRTQQHYDRAITTYKQYLDKIGVRHAQLSQKTLDTSSSYLAVSLRLIECYVETNRIAEGTDLLNEIIRPDTIKSRPLYDSKTYLNIGRLFLKMNKVTEAQHYLKKITNPSDLAEGYYLLGNSYESEGKFDTAKAYYDSIIAKKIQSEWTILAQSRSALLSLIVAETSSQKKHELPVKDETVAVVPKTLDTLPEKDSSKIHINNNRASKPDTVFEFAQYQQNDTGQPTSVIDPAEQQFHLAEIYNLNLKKYQQALIEYEKVYTQYPKSAYAPKAAFAQAWIYKNIFKADSDSSIYNQDLKRVLNKIIFEYPNTEYARAAKEMLPPK
ncbi:MAG: tetratricopeptide repeat protein [candidate division WOR-3 bacterium]